MKGKIVKRKQKADNACKIRIDWVSFLEDHIRVSKSLVQRDSKLMFAVATFILASILLFPSYLSQPLVFIVLVACGTIHTKELISIVWPEIYEIFFWQENYYIREIRKISKPQDTVVSYETSDFLS